MRAALESREVESVEIHWNAAARTLLARIGLSLRRVNLVIAPSHANAVLIEEMLIN